MKIAIPSNDQVTISKHFGKTSSFMICEMENNKIIKKEYKQNTFTGHAQGNHGEGHEHGHHNHSHEGIFKAIGDCKVVIAGGMGKRLYNDFEQKSIKIFVTSEENIENALDMFLNGKLDNNPNKCCSH